MLPYFRGFWVRTLPAITLLTVLLRPLSSVLAAAVATRADVCFDVPACDRALAATVLAALLDAGFVRTCEAFDATRGLVFSFLLIDGYSWKGMAPAIRRHSAVSMLRAVGEEVCRRVPTTKGLAAVPFGCATAHAGVCRTCQVPGVVGTAERYYN